MMEWKKKVDWQNACYLEEEQIGANNGDELEDWIWRQTINWKW
jgi:hypothetical protein